VGIQEYEALKINKTRFAEAVQRMGPPDRLDFIWDDTGAPKARLEYSFMKSRSSNFFVDAPMEEIQDFNAGVRFFLLFLNVIRGGPVIPAELGRLDLYSTESPAVWREGRRLSDMHLSRRGSTLRLSRLRQRERMMGGPEEPLRPFTPFVMTGEGRGRDQIRLEFNGEGILMRKEIRKGAPETGFGDQLRESVLR
jgi:hypothetical protein